jgi:dihydropyrimidinase
MDLILRNGRIYYKGELVEGDIGIDGEIIQEIGDLRGRPGRLEIDVEGRTVFPGIIDSHTHFGIEMMGVKSPDDFWHGSKSAIYGGVTTVIDFTEQRRGESLIKSFERRKEEAEKKSILDFSLHINLTDFRIDYKKEIGELISRGVRSFKFFTAYRARGLMASDEKLYETFSIIKENGGLAMVHCENGNIVDYLVEKFIKEGKGEAIYHSLSRPNFVEAEAISRVIYIAEATSCPLYIVHVSTKEGLLEVKRAKERGVELYAETCPQYLLLTEEKLMGEEGIYYIATPPLRKEEDCEALFKGISEGLIDIVSTDHASFTKKQKKMGGGLFYKTPNGLPGVETLFPLLYTEGYLKGRITLKRLIEVLSINPGRIFGLKGKGEILEGNDADMVVVDDGKTLKLHHLHGNTDFCPYEGMVVRGVPYLTIRRGEILLRDGEFLGSNKRGRFIKCWS